MPVTTGTSATTAGPTSAGPTTIGLTCLPVVSYAMAHNRIPVVDELVVTADRDAEGAVLELAVVDAEGVLSATCTHVGGGTFAVAEEAVSVLMGADRIADHVQAGADVMVATDSSCLMHMEGIIRRRGLPLRTMHVAEILAGRSLPPVPRGSRK